MIFYLVSVTPPQIAALRGDPSLSIGLAHLSSCLERGGTLDELLNENPPQLSGAPDDLVKELEAYHQQQMAAVAKIAPLGIAPSFCLQKDWHILHFLLSGSVGAVDRPEGALFAGDPIGADLGYGAGRLLSPDATAAFAAAIQTRTAEELVQNADMSALIEAGAYGAPYSAEDYDPAELLDALNWYFPQFQAYVAKARDEGAGLFVWIS